MSRKNPSTKEKNPAKVPVQPATIDIPKGGITEFFLNRGWVIYEVVRAGSGITLQDVTDRARKTYGKDVMVVYRAGTTATVLVRETRRLYKKGKRS